MPLLLNDKDIVAELTELHSALIVPCNMCPAVTIAVRDRKPFMRIFRSLLTSMPFHQHIKALQYRLEEKGIKTKVFKSRLYHHWFMCMWTSGQRKRLMKQARKFEAVIVLGCDSATETVRELVKATDCKVIEGMEVVGIMKARPQLHFPDRISFEECEVIALPQPQDQAHASHMMHCGRQNQMG